jgi:hypothetical protein
MDENSRDKEIPGLDGSFNALITEPDTNVVPQCTLLHNGGSLA